MNDMYARRVSLETETRRILCKFGAYPKGSVTSEMVKSARVAAANLAARAEVLEREYATVSRIISAIESRAKAEEVQVLQDAICLDPPAAGSVQPFVCDSVSQG